MGLIEDVAAYLGLSEAWAGIDSKVQTRMKIGIFIGLTSLLGMFAIQTSTANVSWGTGTVRQSDSKTVTVEPDETVQLRWTSGNRTETLAEWHNA